MSTSSSLLTSFNFVQKIKEFCSANNLVLSKLDTNSAVLRFTASSGNTQILYIVRYEDTLEFSVPTAFSFNDLSDVNGLLSAYLLNRNAQRKVGFWCIEKINNKFFISVMHNAPLSLLDANYFGYILQALVKECDQFETDLAQLLNA